MWLAGWREGSLGRLLILTRGQSSWTVGRDATTRRCCPTSALHFRLLSTSPRLLWDARPLLLLSSRDHCPSATTCAGCGAIGEEDVPRGRRRACGPRKGFSSHPPSPTTTTTIIIADAAPALAASDPATAAAAVRRRRRRAARISSCASDRPPPSNADALPSALEAPGAAVGALRPFDYSPRLSSPCCRQRKTFPLAAAVAAQVLYGNAIANAISIAGWQTAAGRAIWRYCICGSSSFDKLLSFFQRMHRCARAALVQPAGCGSR